ncbi:hypothetical protein [Pseudarthrobacter siccitolerans]|uniref:hypothetical protein n=1 Tax=Pseudarthrobacter siccitolerans TaxID=861266 RepID=UPI00128C05FB|nr:hypothetical protein [Pseudarthrobacter siccitolerans]
MDTIPAVLLVLAAAIAWLGLTVFVLLRLRRRRRGSSVVASAPESADGGHVHRPWRRVRRPTGSTPAGRRRLSVRKVRG